MTEEMVIVPSSGDTYMELAHTTRGRLFEKHILNKGTLHYPGVKGGKVEITDSFITSLVNNFKTGVAGIVQVPVADKDNKHTEDPNRNIGEVVDLRHRGGKVFAVIEARDTDAADRLGKTLLGASAMMSLDYTDTRTGKKVGPTLLHSCVTNRPHVVDLEAYQEIVAASADSGDKAVMLTEDVAEDLLAANEEPKMTKEELLAALKADHGVDVVELESKLGAVASESEANKAAVASLTSALETAGVVKLSNGEELTPTDVAKAVSDLATGHLELSAKVDELTNDRAAVAVDALVQAGRILPAQRDAMLTLKLTNEELFTALVPEQPLIKLNAEEGVVTDDSEGELKLANGSSVEDYLAKLTGADGPASQFVKH